MSTAKSFMKILVATDFSESSAAALDAAIYLAGKLGASVTLMHAYTLPVYAAGPIDGMFFPTPDDVTRVGAAAQQHLDAAVSARKHSHVPVAALLRYGEPAAEILAVAQDLGVDMIVMGTHGRGLISRALLGSVAQKVVRTAKQPVLVVPRTPPTANAPDWKAESDAPR
jgi:nucleotide-binding universal stress UspA family protein